MNMIDVEHDLSCSTHVILVMRVITQHNYADAVPEKNETTQKNEMIPKDNAKLVSLLYLHQIFSQTCTPRNMHLGLHVRNQLWNTAAYTSTNKYIETTNTSLSRVSWSDERPIVMIDVFEDQHTVEQT